MRGGCGFGREAVGGAERLIVKSACQINRDYHVIKQADHIAAAAAPRHLRADPPRLRAGFLRLWFDRPARGATRFATWFASPVACPPVAMPGSASFAAPHRERLH